MYDQTIPLTDEQLNEIDARRQAATKGPWLANARIGVVTDHAGQPLAVFGGGAQDRADAEFTAHAREDVPALVADLRRARTELAAERERYKAGLQRADETNNRLMEEVQRYADGKEAPVLWSVYNAMHLRAANAEGRVRELERPGAEADIALTSDQVRAIALVGAAEWYAQQGGTALAAWQVAADLRRRADAGDPAVGSLARDGFGADEIAAMLASPVSGASGGPVSASEAPGGPLGVVAPAKPSHGHSGVPEATGAPQTPADAPEAPGGPATPDGPPQGHTAAPATAAEGDEDDCEDCGRTRCPDCTTHYCCEPCPCERSHTCTCACADYDERLTYTD